MNYSNSDNISFQITVGQLICSSQLPMEDFHVTVCVGDVSKITCSGSLSEDSLVVTWNHPFLFSAPSSMTIAIAICILPKELTMEWEKQALGDQIVTNVACLLESGNTWQCNVPGIPDQATLTVTCRACNMMVIPEGHECLKALSKYDVKLLNFGRQFKNVSCMSTRIEVNLARLDLCPLGHANHIGILDDLAVALSSSYEQQGNISDLHKALEIQQTRLDLCPLGHSQHAYALGWLAINLWKYYCIQKNQADLDRLMQIQQEWLDLCPLGHSLHPIALSEYAISLWECYDVQGNISDLYKSIEMGEKSLELCSTDHSHHDTAVHVLSLSIKTLYDKQGNLSDLNRAIDLQEECLASCPEGHPDHGGSLQNLASSIYARYKRTKNHTDLNLAIKLLKKALDTYPVEHRHFASTTQSLARTTFLLYETPCPSDQQLPSLDEAFDIYQALKTCGPAVSLNLLKAVQAWVQDAENFDHSSVLDAYQTLLTTLDHFTSFNSSLDSRHETMQARISDPDNNAVSCATRHGNFQMAVELMEQGRGILWNQLARFDISMAALENYGDRGREFGKEFTRLSAKLRKHAQQSGDSHDSAEPYWRVLEEWQSVVDKIRHLDGFSRFLLPPQFEDLQQAAKYGPIIIVNASEYTCDALIVLHTRSPVHVPLPCSFADADQLCSQLSELTRDAHAYGDHREIWVKQTLRELWSSVVEPITLVLQNDIHLPPGSRIWWCPTSKFTTLPLHAAGPHRKAQKNFFDIYVSSYAPSLSALLRAQERIRSQKAARDASGKANPISFAAVGQGRPSVDTGLGELPEVEHEICKIRDQTGMPTDAVTFNAVTDTAASIEGAIQAFRDHHWVHLACHGAQHGEKPFESWFAMGDGKLTLMRIIQERYMNSEFAFLSACHTAVGDASTPDEVLHLAAGMQFAGFNGVIGTLWRVDDAVAHQVVTRFYEEMFRQPVIGFEQAAAALNTAVVETADEVSLEKRIVFVHIGI